MTEHDAATPGLAPGRGEGEARFRVAEVGPHSPLLHAEGRRPSPTCGGTPTSRLGFGSASQPIENRDRSVRTPSTASNGMPLPADTDHPRLGLVEQRRELQLSRALEPGVERPALDPGPDDVVIAHPQRHRIEWLS